MTLVDRTTFLHHPISHVFANHYTAVTGMADLYNMAPDLSLFLAVVSIALSGDPVAGTWSIGSGFTPVLPLTTAGGLVSTHNKYEGDASFGRVSLSPLGIINLWILQLIDRPG